MATERSWNVKLADQTDGSIRLRDSSLHIDPTDATRPVRVSRTAIMVAHVGVATDAPYGTLCTISEDGLDKIWRILSDVELVASSYNAPDTTKMGYDFYMAPDLFKDFLSALGVGAGTQDLPGSSGQPRVTEYQATRFKGFLFAIKLIAVMFGTLLLVGGAAFLFAELFPEYEEDAVMVLVGLIPFVSFGVIWGILHFRGPEYRIRISPGEIVITRTGKPERTSIKLDESAALQVNWVASGRYGRRRAGPAYEFVYGDQVKTRIALSDPLDMWEGKVPEIGEPHFVISRQAWDALRRVVR